MYRFGSHKHPNAKSQLQEIMTYDGFLWVEWKYLLLWKKLCYFCKINDCIIFQVGSLKNTRYVTVTSTFEKSFEPSIEPTATKVAEPLTENILATTGNYAKDNNFLDSSIATLPPIYLASDVETPPLETLTETFSTTQTMLKTHILPVVRFGNDTISSTLVQTYIVTRWVRVMRVFSQGDYYRISGWVHV